MQKVAIAEDEDDLREAVAEYLADRGLHVLQARNGRELRALVERDRVDLVILDIQMPGEDGLSLARWLREHSRIGIIFATAADQPVDRIVGLELGADDYVTKPYELRELLARVRSVLRRLTPTGDPGAIQAAAPAISSSIAVGAMTIDVAARRLRRADGSLVKLTPGEFDLLLILAERPNRTLSRDQLAELLGEPGGENGRALDIRVTRIRRKLEEDASTRHCLRTVRGEGYMFVPEARS